MPEPRTTATTHDAPVTDERKQAARPGATAAQKPEGARFPLDKLFQERSDTPEYVRVKAESAEDSSTEGFAGTCSAPYVRMIWRCQRSIPQRMRGAATASMLLYVCYNKYELGPDPGPAVNTTGLARPLTGEPRATR